MILRIGQRHQLSFNGFRKIFQTTSGTDMDFCMTVEQLDDFGRRCRLPYRSLSLIRHSFCRFVARPPLKELLLQRNQDGIDYRFCRYCWRNDQIPYLRLDWRFHNATHCRIHGEPLESRCNSCAKPLATHRSMLGGGSIPPPVSNLAICLYCRHDMRQISKKNRYLAEYVSWKQIHFQNAIISAILNGHFQTEAEGAKRPVDELPNYLATIGRKKGLTLIRPFGTLSRNDARHLTQMLDKAIQKSMWLTPKKGATFMPSGLELKNFLKEIRSLNKKVPT